MVYNEKTVLSVPIFYRTYRTPLQRTVMKKLRIIHGQLFKIWGKAAASARFHFAGAELILEGNGSATDFFLNDHVPCPPAVLRPLINTRDAAWVRARIPFVFHFTPEPADLERNLICTGFVAVDATKLLGFPFFCTDVFGRTGLIFSTTGPDRETRQAIAASFWELLLDSPNALVDYSESMYNPETAVWFQFGCENGSVYCRQTIEMEHRVW